MGKIFSITCITSKSFLSESQSVEACLEVYDNRKRTPIIELSLPEASTEIQIDLRDILTILEQCDLTGFTPKEAN
jgi:hypothetical protein